MIALTHSKLVSDAGLEDDESDGKEQQRDKVDQGEDFGSDEGLAVVGCPREAVCHCAVFGPVVRRQAVDLWPERIENKSRKEQKEREAEAKSDDEAVTKARTGTVDALPAASIERARGMHVAWHASAHLISVMQVMRS